MQIDDTEFTEWLEDAVRTIYEKKPTTAGFVAKMEDGETVTAYFNADPEDKASFAWHFQSEAMLDIIETNAAMIRRWLEDAEDDQ